MTESRRPGEGDGSRKVDPAGRQRDRSDHAPTSQRPRRGKYEVEALFAAVPLRALIDPRLTDRDVRRLAVIAAHDQMSLVTNKGQGAWASHARMAGKVGDGSNESNFSVAVKRLTELGYLEVSRKADDRRHRVYRVIYSDEDSLFWSKVSSAGEPCSEANDLSGDTLLESTAEYIPETRSYSAEAEKEYSTEVARRSARQASQEGLGQSVGAQLARLERHLKDDPHSLDIKAWLAWLDNVRVDQTESPANVGRAARLVEELVGLDAALDEWYALVGDGQ